MIVVDASIALAWCFANEQDEYADRILDRVIRESAIAPAHWPLEVANGLRTAERCGRIADADVSRASRLLNDLGVEIVPVELSTATGSVLDVARDHDLTTYDAVYLDLASFRGLSLATIDGALAAACRRAGVDLVP
ncbi:MAG: type II toxin-antitoxin system VapC family toxin [Candidatus Limnocylindrales bacterium]